MAKRGLQTGELTATVVLAIDSQLLGQRYTLFKPTLLLEIQWFEAGEGLPYPEDDLAVLETADGQGSGEVSKAQLLRLFTRLAEVVGKAELTAAAPLTLGLMPFHRVKPSLVVIVLPNYLQVVHLGNFQECLIPLICFLLGENVGVGEVKHRAPPLLKHTLNAGCTAGSATGMDKDIVLFHMLTIHTNQPLLQPLVNPCRV